MLKNIKNALIRALQDAAERKAPRIRWIDGLPYAYCHVRQEWVKVRFNGEK